ncbi:MAG TPA: ATP-binding protein [Kiritimatiellia bacterium]|nr:ATP-binding protein [Kiritimatiellia bacterium]
MNNPIRIRYFLWLAALLLAYFTVNSATLLAINLPSILARGPDWREEFHEWLVITGVGGVLLPGLLFAAWRLSRRMLKPLRDIVDTSNRIDRGHLSERIHVQDTHDEIADLAASLNRALDRYEEAVRRQRQFAGTASHQLRTPLTSIRTIGEITLQHDRTPESYREAIGTMLEEAGRLARIVEQLLLMAKLNHQDLRATFTAVHLPELFAETTSRHEPLLLAKRIRLTSRAAPGTTAWGHPALLDQALSNLLDNAIRHTPNEGAITLAATPSPNRFITISVSDSGPGFSSQPSTSPLPPDNPADTRSGLGLNIVREIVRAHDGDIEIQSIPGHGATIGIRIPIPPTA